MPASRMIVLKPMVHQTVAIRIEIHAHGWELSQPGAWMPNQPKTSTMSPPRLCRIQNQSRPTTATDRVHGAK